MKLDELRKIIRETTTEDWNHIHCWGGGAGPSYRDRTVTALVGKTDAIENEVESHGNVAILRDDIDISIAWGLDLDFRGLRDAGSRPPRSFDWAKNFPNEDVWISIGDIFYRGSLVDRVLFAVVDGGRVLLPWAHEQFSGPDEGDVVTSSWEYDFARLVDHFEGVSEFDEAFAAAGFKIVD
ncbi:MULTISPECIES: hypothetical protein [Rhodococcus]|jgi:hypothetical protein|nr:MULTISPECIES: hypothetical protein [Rhodococcus]ELB95049.1 hypothetical protein Rwratislav_00525 [Rhodococcus wratislaviensis IFP 2016]QHE74474.1 hypothetical protein GFS60_08178 [Rhodococcus sp. WAY2]